MTRVRRTVFRLFLVAFWLAVVLSVGWLALRYGVLRSG